MTTTYKVEYDEGSVDPREDDLGEGHALAIVGGPYRVDDLAGHDEVGMRAFATAFNSSAAYVAHPRQRDLIAFAAKVAKKVDPTFQLHDYAGYSQGDWATVATVGEQGKAVFDMWAQWARGDVFMVTAYDTQTCNLGHEHLTPVGSLGGIYADTEEEAIAHYKENEGQ